MSAAITTGEDLVASARLTGHTQLFTTFATGHFVKPAAATQPVAVKSFSYSEVFAAAPLDLDYDEPNSVVEQELDVIAAGDPVHYFQVKVSTSKPAPAREIASRIAA